MSNTLQYIFDKNSLESVPRINRAIAEERAKNNLFGANQMKCYTLRTMMNLPKPIITMTDIEVEKYSTDLLEIFKNNGWIEI